jgi:hypothetical protein
VPRLRPSLVFGLNSVGCSADPLVMATRPDKDIEGMTKRLHLLLDRLEQGEALDDEELHLLGGALKFFCSPTQATRELTRRPKAAERILKGLGNPDWQLIRADLFKMATAAITASRKVKP